jgi:hypothetical protein
MPSKEQQQAEKVLLLEKRLAKMKEDLKNLKGAEDYGDDKSVDESREVGDGDGCLERDDDDDEDGKPFLKPRFKIISSDSAEDMDDENTTPTLKPKFKTHALPTSGIAVSDSLEFSGIDRKHSKCSQTKNVFTLPAMVLTQEQFLEMFYQRIPDTLLVSLAAQHLSEFLVFQKKFIGPLCELGSVNIDLDDIENFNKLGLISGAKRLFTDGMLLKREERRKHSKINVVMSNDLRDAWLLFLGILWIKLGISIMFRYFYLIFLITSFISFVNRF